PATTLAPGATIGILGGGQLGRMIALAAARLGFRCHVFAAEANSPAAQVCGAATVAEFSDRDALECFAAAVAIATFEFENIPAEEAWRRMGGEIGILESFVDFACEISVIVARGRNGVWATYPPVENQHAGHILDTTIAPARIAAETAMRAEVIARHIAEKLDLVGVLAVEMFVTQTGDILVNEIAPRPHNSGH